MSANHTLNRLVSQMSIEERHGLLEKIRRNSTISLEPLYVSKEEDGRSMDFEGLYKELPWFVRLFYFVIGFFSGKAAVKVYENGQMLAMGRSIEASAPGVYDYRNNRLSEGFLFLLVELKDAARFFYNVLDTSINKDRGAFYAILGSLEMEDLHKQLQGECNPQAVFKKHPDILPSNLRQATLRVMDETLQTIPESKRGIMFYHARSLNYLKEMSCFLFDRFILAFEGVPGVRFCRVNSSVREMLFSLDNILFSLRDPPTLSLFESLFVYELETRAGESGFDMDAEMVSLLSQAEKALATIRGFNTRIPLTRLIRCATRNTKYSPAQISGGEDWFQVYRNYWKQQTETALAEYFIGKKYQDVIGSLEAFFGAAPQPLANVASNANGDGFPLPEGFALSFLKAFHSILQGSIHSVLRPIIMEGEFTRREDRMGLTEAYNDLLYTAGHIQKLDEKMAPSGEYGKLYALARKETEALSVKRRKMQSIQQEASKEAWAIILRSCDGMKNIVVLLEGILSKDQSAERACLVNFNKLAGKTPSVFVGGIAKVIDNLRLALQVLNDMSSIGNLI